MHLQTCRTWQHTTRKTKNRKLKSSGPGHALFCHDLSIFSKIWWGADCRWEGVAHSCQSSTNSCVYWWKWLWNGCPDNLTRKDWRWRCRSCSTSLTVGCRQRRFRWNFCKVGIKTVLEINCSNRALLLLSPNDLSVLLYFYSWIENAIGQQVDGVQLDRFKAQFQVQLAILVRVNVETVPPVRGQIGS